MTRSVAYRWLSERLGIPEEECHISWFDIDTCKKVIQLSNDYQKARK